MIDFAEFSGYNRWWNVWFEFIFL